MTSQKQTVFEAIQDNDMITIDGLVLKTRLTQHMVSRRISELADEGLIYVMGEIKSITGRNQSMWSATKPENIEAAKRFRNNAKFRRWAKQSSMFRNRISASSYQDITKYLRG